MKGPVEMALVGCGAIAQTAYLPALGSVPDIRCRWLVDVQRDLAERAARRWGIPHVATDFSSVLERIEAVILAVPPHLHEPMAVEALGRGRAVLCEKPLGRTEDEVLRMVEASRRAGVPLVAGMIFRQYPGLQRMRAEFPWRSVGRVREIVARYGIPLDWPLASPYLLDRERAGGGVWLDLGVHVLDALLWVFEATDVSVVEYRDDGNSGLEAEAHARLALGLAGEGTRTPCLVEVSRLRRLDNRLTVVGEQASLLIPFSGADAPCLQGDGGAPAAPAQPVPPRDGVSCFAEQLRAFARRVRGLPAECADGGSQVPVLEVIDACYARRESLARPWQSYVPWPRG